jgi:hypothetical protein
MLHNNPLHPPDPLLPDAWDIPPNPTYTIHDIGVNWYFPYYMEDLMAELTHTPPRQHHPSFPGGSKFLEGQEMARMHGLQ